MTEPPVILAYDDWRAREAAHHERVDAVTRDHLTRRERGEKHPVEDFMWVYYRHRPGQLRRWHPGAGVVLAGDDPSGRSRWSGYVRTPEGITLDVPVYVADRRDKIARIRELVAATARRAPRLGCFGLHEWAMVYRLAPGAQRHEAWPLRLGSEGTDAVVESLPLACTHFDAFRFFTPEALPRNPLRLTRGDQQVHEQPGCLHATMDLYTWSFTLAPLVGSDLVMDAFATARRARELDMRASPYDLRDLGFAPIPVETPEGRAEYVRHQREIAAAGQALRTRLLATLEAVDCLAAAPGSVSAGS